MERPRLRPLEAFPVENRGQKLLVFRDPSRLGETVSLPPLAVAVVSLLDGESTRDEICAEFQRRYHQVLTRDALDQLLDRLDQAHLLDSDKFHQHAATVFAEFARAPVRPAFLAGESYPADPSELRALLDGFFAAPNGPGKPAPSSGPLPRAVIAPHIDFQRGGPAYAWAYRDLAAASDAPELVVVFGTNHNGAEHPFALTRKHYDTPLGRIDTDVALVDAITAAVRERLGEPQAQSLFRDEHHHRGEHSIEFQMVWLRHLFGARADAMKALPVLCGSLHEFVESSRDPVDNELIATVLETIGRAADGRRVLWLAGADLAHVGPRFGDADPLDREDYRSLEKRDHETLQPVLRGDARGWLGEIRRERDMRRVCGLPPIYHLLHTAQPKEGKLLVYAQCPADERGGSLVSIASAVFAT